MRVFEITPKRIKRTNNTVLTPEMKKTSPPSSTSQTRFTTVRKKSSITKKPVAHRAILHSEHWRSGVARPRSEKKFGFLQIVF
ncbi:MAG: hypothetical protein IKQ30_02405 [Bacteroidales bacterium]|nr:hypothetical protein [Bacteroidales bacterium]